MVRRLLLVIFAIFLSVSGCGGGDSGSQSTLHFSADKKSISFEYDEGGAQPAPQFVTVTASGTYNGALYVGAVATGTGINPSIIASITGATATFQIDAAQGLVEGIYDGVVQLMACSDAACTRQIGNSPISISYRVVVRRVLKLTPMSISESAISGAGLQRTVSVQLPDGQNSYAADVTSGSSWLTISNVAATSFEISLASLPSGTYSGTIHVRSGGFDLSLPVNYQVLPPAGGDRFLSATPSSVTMSTTEGASTSASLSVSAPSWSSLVNAQVEYPQNTAESWLFLTSVSGGYQVLASATNLKTGTYSATVRLSGAYPSADVLVPVSLTVGVGLIKPADIPIVINAETSSASLSGSVMIGTVDGQSTDWTASSDAQWLVLNKSSGAAGESLAYQVDMARLAGLANPGVHIAQVAVTPSVASMTPISFSVILSKNLPAVTSIGPYVHLTGQPVRLIIRGSGFASISNLASRFTVQNGMVNSASRVNDTEVILQVGSLSVGKHIVSASNRLGVATQLSSVTAVAAPSYSYAAIPTGGPIKHLVYDAERNSLYGVNPYQESLVRFRSSGSSWQVDSVSVPKAYDVGMTQDGSKLLLTHAVSGFASLTTLDAESMAQLSDASLGVGLGPGFDYSGFGIQATNDGRNWFATSYYGPWYAVSRDGERLIMVQADRISPFLPMLYMDASDSVFKVIPTPVVTSYHIAMSESGDRVMLDNSTILANDNVLSGITEVRDSALNFVGNVVIPEIAGYAYQFRAAVMSLDGVRLYVLAYRRDWIDDLGALPRVFVFDSFTRQAVGGNLSLLGYFDLPEYPSCGSSADPNGPCYVRDYLGPQSSDDRPTVSAGISLDSKALFFAGNSKLLVVPVPSTLVQVASSSRARAFAQENPKVVTTKWLLNLH